MHRAVTRCDFKSRVRLRSPCQYDGTADPFGAPLLEASDRGVAPWQPRARALDREAIPKAAGTSNHLLEGDLRLLFHAKPMGSDSHRSFNFNKLRSFLIARVWAVASFPSIYWHFCEARVGVELDSDQFVAPGVDYMPLGLTFVKRRQGSR